MRLMKLLESKTEGWWVKEKIRPLYMPFVNRMKYRTENKNFLKEGDTVLHAASKVLNSIQVFHWLEFGTLLGVIRDGRLISHDTDIDFGVFLNDYSDEIRSAFVKAGFRLVHRIEIEAGKYGLEESYELNGVKVDLFYFTKTNSGMYCHLFPSAGKNKRLVRELFTSVNTFKTMEWQSLNVNIPADSAQRLTDTYGDFHIKRKDWNTPNQALNSELINKLYVEIT
jgi:phosphorylcholine metabolism protein LicD